METNPRRNTYWDALAIRAIRTASLGSLPPGNIGRRKKRHSEKRQSVNQRN